MHRLPLMDYKEKERACNDCRRNLLAYRSFCDGTAAQLQNNLPHIDGQPSLVLHLCCCTDRLPLIAARTNFYCHSGDTATGAGDHDPFLTTVWLSESQLLVMYT